MDMNTYFYIISIQDNFIRAYLDLLRFIANPNEKRTSHITVRGPYKKKINLLQKSADILGKNVTITGAGCFFSKKQNTVYLNCESDAIRKVWLKKSLNYNPHLTIYDGNNRSFAESILTSLTANQYRITFTSTDLIPLRICKGQTDADLLISVDINLLGRLLKTDIDLDTIKTMTEHNRINVFSELSSFLPHLTVRR
jgi:hypothetical protein